MDYLLDNYRPGYIEAMGSVGIQVIYIICGLIAESFRAPYFSATSKQILTQSLWNHIAATMTHVAYVMFRGGESVLTRTFLRPYSLPSWTEFVTHLVAGLVLRDALFYVLHRIGHIPGIYERMHAKHHEIKEPANHHVLTISYMSVLDFMLLYGFPVVGIAKLLEMNLLTALSFSFISASGEQVKLIWGDEAHDEHHVNGKVNLGVYGLMDWLCGTSSVSIAAK